MPEPRELEWRHAPPTWWWRVAAPLRWGTCPGRTSGGTPAGEASSDRRASWAQLRRRPAGQAQGLREGGQRGARGRRKPAAVPAPAAVCRAAGRSTGQRWGGGGDPPPGSAQERASRALLWSEAALGRAGHRGLPPRSRLAPCSPQRPGAFQPRGPAGRPGVGRWPCPRASAWQPSHCAPRRCQCPVPPAWVRAGPGPGLALLRGPG